MTSNNYFTFDKCYSKPTAVSEASFNRILANDFYHSTVSSVRDCEIQSIRTNSEFFLINDISSTLNNNIYTNCYIPKVDNNTNNTSIFGNDTTIQRALQLFDSLFNNGSTTNPPYSTQPMPIADSCNNLLFNLNKPFNQQVCFKYVIDEQIYTPKSKYAYYRRPLLTSDNINIMRNMTDPSTYTDSTTLAQLTQFEELLKFDTTDPTYTSTNSGHGALTRSFKNYICTPTPENLRLLNVEITALNTNYNNLFTKLDDIKTDLSSINYLNSFDNNTLRAINLNIITKSKELNNLLTSGGANNGRLDDSTLLTQFKIIENIILVLLIIYFIFYFTKKKAT
uniref:Uncharacterized protein n=1 Tax=viral metagenome TaxID=1070528 RepID=A0A6C0H4R1_9ZZZZ